MYKKGAIELSMNLLVVIIISLTILTFGIGFLYNTSEVSAEAQEQLAQKSEQQIRKSLEVQQKQVAISQRTASLKSGENGMFGVGILNLDSTNEKFSLELELDKVIDKEGKDITNEIDKEETQSWFMFDQEPMIIEENERFTRQLLITPKLGAFSGQYFFKLRVFTQDNIQYGNTQTIIVDVEGKGKLPEKSLSTLQQPCLDDLNCEYYFIYVPIGDWEHPKLFEAKVEERTGFFIDITKFKFLKVGTVLVPLEFVKDNCNLQKVNPNIAREHLKIKNCADKYADQAGIEYERAIGLTSTYEGGRTFFNGKSCYATLGHTLAGEQQETPSLVAHELGHTYNLCDEYSYKDYLAQNRFVKRNTCQNKFPDRCREMSGLCEGGTPTYRDYEGDPVLNVCYGDTHYTIMGAASGSECGLDKTGGYEAMGDLS